MNQQKKGAILIPSLYGGGAERVALYLAKNINQQKSIEIDIICMETQAKYDLPSNINYNYLSNISYDENRFKKIANTLPQISELHKIVKEKEYDFLITFLNRPLALLFVYSFLFSYNFKVIVSYRNFMSRQINNYKSITNYIVNKIIYRYIIKKSGIWADLVISNSQSSRSDLIENFGIPNEKIISIRNPIDIKKINLMKVGDNHLRQRFDKLFQFPTFITIGSLTKQKGHDFLIRAFSLLKPDAKESKLIIIGEGNLLDSHIKLSSDLGMSTFVYNGGNKIPENKDIYFLGFQKNPYYFLFNSKVFVFPSLWEGFPNSLLEAIICGLTVISSDCKSGPREIISPSTNPNYQTLKPELSKFGILMPPPTLSSNNSSEMRVREKLWGRVMLKTLETEINKFHSDKEIDVSHHSKTNSKIFETWNSIINNTISESRF